MQLERGEPNSSLNAVCPYCDAWFNTNRHPEEFSDLIDRNGRIIEIYYCDSQEHDRVELLDSAECGMLTPHQEWERNKLIEKMEQLESEARRVRQQLNEYYMYEDGRGV